MELFWGKHMIKRGKKPDFWQSISNLILPKRNTDVILTYSISKWPIAIIPPLGPGLEGAANLSPRPAFFQKMIHLKLFFKPGSNNRSTRLRRVDGERSGSRGTTGLRPRPSGQDGDWGGGERSGAYRQSGTRGTPYARCDKTKRRKNSNSNPELNFPAKSNQKFQRIDLISSAWLLFPNFSIHFSVLPY